MSELSELRQLREAVREWIASGDPGYPPDCVKKLLISPAPELYDAAAWLLRLKDGPRDDTYQREKPLAWQALREALAGGKGKEDCNGAGGRPQ